MSLLLFRNLEPLKVSTVALESKNDEELRLIDTVEQCKTESLAF